MRILYVEDELDVVLAMQGGLRQLGAEVDVATSHAEALEKMADGTLDAAVTDLHLGRGPSGMDVAASLHAMPQHAQVPVIAVRHSARPRTLRPQCSKTCRRTWSSRSMPAPSRRCCSG